MKKKSLIVFDIDGTLTDSVMQHQKAFTETLLEIGVSKINSDFKSFKHHTDSFIAKEIYEDSQKKIFSDEVLEKFKLGLSEKIEVLTFNEIKGAKELIDKLEKETSFGVCYATGSLRKAAQHKLKSIGVEFCDWQLVASDKIYERENIIEIAIQNALQHYKIKKFNRIISVGDGLWDLLAAKNLNIEFIGIGEKNKNLFKENGARIVLNDLTQFEL